MSGTLEWWPLQSGQGHWSQGSDLASPGFWAGLWGAVRRRPQGAKGWPSEASHSLPYAPQLWQAQTSGLDPSGELWSRGPQAVSVHSLPSLSEAGCPTLPQLSPRWRKTELQFTNLPALTGIPVCPTPPPIFWVKATYCSPFPSLYLANSYITFKAPIKYFCISSNAHPTSCRRVACFSETPSSSWASPQEPTAAVSHAVPHLAETRFPPSQGPWSHRPSIQMCWVKDDHPLQEFQLGLSQPTWHQEAKGLWADTSHECRTRGAEAAPLCVCLTCISEILEFWLRPPKSWARLPCTLTRSFCPMDDQLGTTFSSEVSMTQL